MTDTKTSVDSYNPTKVEIRGNNYLGIDGLAEHRQKAWSVSLLVSSMSSIDTNPPYQRDLVWAEHLKADFIRSLLSGIATPPIHLVKKKHWDVDRTYWGMDGKQRINAISGFYDSDFPVLLPLEGGGEGEFYYSELLETNPAVITAFLEAQVLVEIYDPMPMATQRLVFNVLNKGVPLKRDEILYGKNYLLQGFLKTIFKNEFAQVVPFTMDSIQNDRCRFGLRQLHIVLLLCYGLRFDEDFAVKSYAQGKRTKSADLIEEMLRQRNIECDRMESDYTWSDDLIKVVGWHDHRVAFKYACRRLHDMITYNNAQPGLVRLDSGLCIDFLSFLIKLHQEQAINSEFVKKHLRLFHLFLVGWVDYKKTNADVADAIDDGSDEEDPDKDFLNYSYAELNTKTQDKATVQKRITGMYEIAKSVGLDLSPKSKDISSTAKLKAALSPGYTCPISGGPLRRDNMEFDHVEAKSLTSGPSSVRIIRGDTNRAKGALDLDALEKTADYVRENSNPPQPSS